MSVDEKLSPDKPANGALGTPALKVLDDHSLLPFVVCDGLMHFVNLVQASILAPSYFACPQNKIADTPCNRAA